MRSRRTRSWLFYVKIENEPLLETLRIFLKSNATNCDIAAMTRFIAQ